MKIYPNADAPARNLAAAPAPPVLLPFTAIAGRQGEREVMIVNLALMGRDLDFPAWFGLPEIALVPLDQAGRPTGEAQTLAFGVDGQPLAGGNTAASYHPHPRGGDVVRQVRVERAAADPGPGLDGSRWALSARFPADHGQAPAAPGGPARTLPTTLWLSFVVAASDETPALLAADPVWLGRELDRTGAFRPFDKVIATDQPGAYADGPFPVLHNRGFVPVTLRAGQLSTGGVTVGIDAATLAPGCSAMVRIGFDATRAGRLRASLPIAAADGSPPAQTTLEVAGIVDPPPRFARDGPQLSAFEAHRGDTVRAIGENMDGIIGVALMDFANAKFHFLPALDSARTAVSFRIAEDVPLGTWRIGLVTQNHGPFHAAVPGAPGDFTPHSFVVPPGSAPFDLPPDALPSADGTLACDVVAISDQLLTMGAWSQRAPCAEFTAQISLIAARDGRLFALRSGTDHFTQDRDWLTNHPGADPYVPGAIMTYDPATDTWSAPVALPLRIKMAAAMGPSGEIFFTGEDRRENYVGSWTAYDPRTGAVRTCAPMPSHRTLVSLTAAGGRIYAIGGYSGSSIGSGRVPRVEAYDPASDSWMKKADMPFAPAGFGVTTATNGRIYVAGGQGDAAIFGPNGMRPNPPYAQLYEYDTAADTWTPRAKLREGRSGIALGAGANGRVYAVGGGATGQVVEEYDPATDRWIDTAPLPHAIWRPAMATAPDGTIYVAGGADKAGPVTAMVAMRP